MRRIALALLFVTTIAGPLPSTNKIAAVVTSVRQASFPQLADATIEFSPLNSSYIYFESRFTPSSFLFSRNLRYVMMVNPEAEARHIPDDGLRAILAHELAHVDYFHRQSRMGLVGLVRLLSARYEAQFERTADLEAIALGYGPGLQAFRTWLYRNVPPDRMEEKRRDYFSPQEIEAILKAERTRPGIMRIFAQCIPRNLDEIQWEVQHGVCPS